MAINDDSMVKIMQSLGLNFNPAEQAIKSFEGRIASLNKQLFEMKALALQGARDINAAFSGQLGQLGGSKVILDQFGQPLKTIQMEAARASTSVGSMAGEYVKTSAAAKKYGETIQETSKKFNLAADQWNRRAQWFLSGTLFYGTLNAAKEAVQTISDVEMGMTQIARITEDVNFNFEGMRDKLLDLGVEYGATFDKVQDIALRWAQAGYNMNDTIELTRSSLLALNTAELNAEQATQGFIAIMSQWGLTAKDLLPTLDKINKVADDFAVTSQDLVDGLNRSSGAARIMGLSIEQTITLLTTMREASGRTGREVGNALNSILSYIQRPKSIDVIEAMGIKMFADNARTQFRNVMDVFSDISAKWQDVSENIKEGFVKSADEAGLFNEELATSLGLEEQWNDLQQRDISQAAAGVYRRNYLIALMQRFADTQKVLISMQNSEGYSIRENIRTMDTLEKKYEALKAGAEKLAVAIGEAGLLDALKGLVDFSGNVIGAFDKMDSSLKSLLINFGLIVGSIKALKSVSGMLGITAESSGAIAALSKLPGIWKLVGVAAGAAGLSIYNDIKKANEETEKQIATVGFLGQSYFATKNKLSTLQSGTSAYNQAQSELHKLMKDIVSTQPELIAGIDDHANITSIDEAALLKVIDAYGKLSEKQKTLVGEMQNMTEEQKRLDKERLNSTIDTLQAQLKSLNSALDYYKNRAPEYIKEDRTATNWWESVVNWFVKPFGAKGLGKTPVEEVGDDIKKTMDDLDKVRAEYEAKYGKEDKKKGAGIGADGSALPPSYTEESLKKLLQANKINIQAYYNELLKIRSDQYSEFLNKSNDELNAMLANPVTAEKTKAYLGLEQDIHGALEQMNKSAYGGSNPALEYALKILEHKKRMNQLSVEDEITTLQKIKSLYAKNAEEILDIDERIYDVEQALKDKEQKAKEDRLQNSINWINQEKEFGRLSAEETLAAWKRVLAKQKDYAEAVKEANKGIFDSYKELLGEQMSEIEKAYNERMNKIDEEAEKQKKVQQDIIDGIEEQEKTLDRSETAYSHEQKMADLQKELAYWSVRTSEEARQKVLDIQKQIADEQHGYEVEKQKQSLEDQKQAAQDKIDQIEKEAEDQKKALKDMWTDIQDIFSDNNKNLIANAALTSEKVAAEYQKILDKIKEVMTSGQFVTTPEGTITMQGASEAEGGAKTATLNTQIKALAEKIVELKYRFDQGDKTAAQEAVSIYNQLEALSTKGHDVATMLHSMGYVSAKDYVANLPQMHSGGETLSYGAVYMKPGELVFPPGLSTKLEALISVLNTRPIQQMQSYPATDNRREIKIDRLLNIEKNYMEDEIDGEILSKQLQRAILAVK